MAWKRVLPWLVGVLIVSALLIALYNTSVENARLKRDFQECQVQLQTLRSGYSALEGTYAEIKLKLANLTWDYEGLRGEHALLMEKYARLNASYTDLMAEYESSLEAYNELKMEHDLLMQNYSLIKSEYARLNASYIDLEAHFERLQETLENINGSYTLLRRVLYEPLTNKTVPKIEELKAWLMEDDVDKIKYAYPDFVCGDYAVMLAYHAKLKGWDMGVVVVVGYYPDRREFNHAFNAIKCREGLVYVEPQTDSVWWNPGYSEIKSESWYVFPDFGRIYVDEVVVAVLY
ncbi:MAG: hypothetical protein QXQ41_06430 [Candidatus Bathyarchaeia archaeon]